MNIKVVFFGSLFAFAASASEQEQPVVCEGPRSSRIDIRHLEYQGIGYDEGYTSLDLFLSNSNLWNGHHLLFLDMRGHIFNDGKPAVNGGGGWRYLFDSKSYAIGFNTYYDFRRTHRKNYNQVGAGFEFLHPQWEFRANGYVPFGARKTGPFDPIFSRFTGNQFFIKGKYEFSMAGADAEFGWHFKQWRFIDLFAGAGPYYFVGPFGKPAIGGKARVQARLTPYVTVEAGDSFDQIFRNRFHVEATISIPFGPRAKTEGSSKRACRDEYWMQQWLHTPPSRQEILVVDKQREKHVAIDPATGLPYYLLFVDNTSSSNGTFESPYSFLADAQTNAVPRTVIYVFSGDGTAINMDAGIDLSGANTDNVRLLGSGVDHGFDTTLGFVTIPAQTSLSPTITNLGATSIVVLGLNNEVSGFNIIDGTLTLPSISGAWNGITVSANINRNQILRSQGNAIDLQPTGCIAEILVEGNAIFSALGMGINCPYVDSVGTATIRNNSVEFATGKGISLIHSGASNVNSLVLNNFIFNTQFDMLASTGDEVHISASGTTVANSIVTGNEITSAQSPPGTTYNILLETDGSAFHNSYAAKNRIANPVFQSTGSVVVRALTGALADSVTETTVDQNVISGGGGIYIASDAGSFGSVEANVSGNALYSCSTGFLPGGSGGVSVVVDGAGGFNAAILNNFMDANTSLGLSSLSVGGSDFTGLLFLNVSGNTISNHSTGMTWTLVRDARFVCNNNRMENISGTAISCNTMGPSLTTGQFSGNQLTNIAFDFSYSNGTAGATNCLRITENAGFHDLQLSNTGGGILQIEVPSTNYEQMSFSGPVVFVPQGTCE